MNATPLHPRKLILFLLLNVADLVLTWVLLRSDHGECYESNPLAGWVLTFGGWLGLVGFKAAVVVVVAGLALIISRSRPQAGGRVLFFACSAVALVVVYSSYLLGSLAVPRSAEAAEYQATKEEDAAWEREWSQVNERHRLLASLSEDVVARRRSLAEAAGALARANPVYLNPFLPQLRERFPGYSEEECLAARLLEESVVTTKAESPAAARRVARQLQKEFQTSFGKPAPSIRHLLATVQTITSRVG